MIHSAQAKSEDHTATPPRDPGTRFARVLPLLALAGSFGARLFQAWDYFLNPDEALHNLLASQSSVSLTYKAALTNAHPPLLILVLYYWRSLGHSELMLRMPSVLAGTACCWIAYCWLKQITDRSTALIGLVLFAFSPALIELSAEIRQYAILLFFAAGCLYCSERAIQKDSPAWMILFSLSLYGALLTHYSALLFAGTMGLYMLVRLRPYARRRLLLVVWGAGQIGGIAIAAYYLLTHVARLRKSGMAQQIAETWLRKSTFHAGDHIVVFIAAQTLRVFTYLLSHGVAGTLALLTFLMGVGSLFRLKKAFVENGPTPRELALLLGLPFVLNCGAALAGAYPYGGTRHSVFLAIFALSGAAIGLALWRPARAWIRLAILLAILAVCNFFPSPPPLIRPRNHRRILMEEAAASLERSAAPGSILLADYESGLLMGYYVCGHGVVQMFPPFQAFVENDCGAYKAFTARPQDWKFEANDFPRHLAELSHDYNLAPATKVSLFYAGWITDSTPALIPQLQRFGCPAPQQFGENILLCQIVLDSDKTQPQASMR